MAKRMTSCALALTLIAAPVALAQKDGPTNERQAPVVFTTQQDHQNMLDQLGITKLRPGRNANADSPNAANYDEALANPYPDLPELLKLATGETVDTPEMWWKKRRPEIVALLESEVYGSVPEKGDAHWLDHQGSFMAAIAAQPVFRLLGARDLGRSDDYMKEKMPGVNVDMLDGALAWRQHDGGHTDEPNVEHFIRWAKRQWGEETDQDASPTPPRDRRSLKKAVGPRFKIGVGVGHYVVRNPEDAALIKQHFQILTAENCMKPQSIHPTEDAWNFEPADRFADFARANNLEIVGHCLVWAKDDRTDQWMMLENGKPVSRETLLRRIETHVNTVVERYADVATMWDVVNEAIGDGDDGLLRDSVYSRTTGMDFIVTAFKAARAKDPDALLIYNDYNGHKPGKRRKLLELLTQLKKLGAPVDAYGMQGHFELGDDSIPQLRETFDELRKLDVKVVVSELDIDVVTRGRWWADGGKYRDELAKYDPYKDGIPEEVQRKQIEQYVELFKLFDEYSGIIERVSFWNLHDGQSWLNYFPWRRVNYPLLFDRNRRPKPVFDAVYASLKTSP